MRQFGGLRKHQNNPTCAKSVVFTMLKSDPIRKNKNCCGQQMVSREEVRTMRTETIQQHREIVHSVHISSSSEALQLSKTGKTECHRQTNRY